MTSRDDEMVCQELVELVTAYVDGVLPAHDRARFEAHLQECPYCVTYLEQMRRTMRLLGQLSDDTIDPHARADLLTVFRDWKA